MKAYTRFGVLPSLSHDIGDASKAERPLPQITISRIAEKAANYSPHAEWDNEVERFRDLMERST